MNTPSQHSLDPFESALLTELTSVVADRSARPATVTPGARSSWARRRSTRLLAGAAAGAAVVGAVTLIPGGGSPAYAVSDDGDGDVTVTISRLEGPEALEKALADKGIAADVTYLPVGKQCAAGRFTPSTRTGQGTFSVAEEDGAQTFMIAKGTVAAGETLVLSSVRPTAEGFGMHIGVAVGEVKPCEPVDGDFPRLPDRTPSVDGPVVSDAPGTETAGGN